MVECSNRMRKLHRNPTENAGDGTPFGTILQTKGRSTEHGTMDVPLNSRGYLAAVAAAVLLGTTAATATAAPIGPDATSSATVTVNATAGEGTVPSIGVGANTAVYDGFLTD